MKTSSILSRMTPDAHEKSEWARFARAAHANGRADVGKRFGAAASLPEGTRIPTTEFDALQNDYRAWLVFNEYPQP